MVKGMNQVTSEDVIKAIEEYTKNSEKYTKHQSKSTFLIYDKHKYPAKTIRKLAYDIHFDADIDFSKFNGGEESKDFFERLGFEIEYKPLKSSNNVHYWIYSPGKQAIKWDEFYEKGIIAVGYVLDNLKQYKDKKDIRQKYNELFNDDSDHRNDITACWEFANVMKKGDIIFVKNGINELIGCGIVESDYRYDKNVDEEYKHIRDVSWKKKGSWKSDEHFPTKTLTDITNYPNFVESLKNSFIDDSTSYSSNTNNFITYLNKKRYFFTKETIENYLLSLKVKPFVILTGNSGTGKTKLAQLFAQYLQKKLDYADNYAVVAVGANWSDNRNIIGYYNPLLEHIEETPTSKFIKRANDDLDNPYFLILDEMNLSYVERYFSDFLSALESGEKMDIPGFSSKNDSYKEKENIKEENCISENIGGDNSSDDDGKIELPPNLFVIGTVNVDETTYMFSPKVLDRANVLEFKTIPVKDYMNTNFVSNFNQGVNIKFLENPLSHHRFKDNTDEKNTKEKIDIKDLKEKYSEIDNSGNLWNNLKSELTKLHKILQESGFDFGFRVTNEILIFIYEAYYYDDKEKSFEWERYLDAQIIQKVLPKIHGSKNQIEDTLKKLYEFCLYTKSADEKNESDEYSNEKIRFISSAIKIKQMLGELDKSRYVSFIS